MTATTATDEELFHEFVASRGRALARTAYLLTGDHHLAEDLLQTALFQAARNWHRIEGHPEAYVRRILYNQNISWWRRRRLVEIPMETYDAARPGPDTDLRLTLQQALERLTLRQRTILVLRFFEDLTEVQTAEELGNLGRRREVEDPPGARPAAGPRARARGTDRNR